METLNTQATPNTAHCRNGLCMLVNCRDGITPQMPVRVVVYALRLDELTRVARSRLTRSWTPEECRQYLRTETCPNTP